MKKARVYNCRHFDGRRTNGENCGFYDGGCSVDHKTCDCVELVRKGSELGKLKRWIERYSQSATVVDALMLSKVIGEIDKLLKGGENMPKCKGKKKK